MVCSVLVSASVEQVLEMTTAFMKSLHFCSMRNEMDSDHHSTGLQWL